MVSLPTSAGKTRIAELCILRCLAGGKRVVFVTPLRAFRRRPKRPCNGPLGRSARRSRPSTAALACRGFDEDAIRERDIVVATPEKLDFALRNDPSLLDDVGLLVFDEGHMIGPNEREVRYEVQIQRLLRRPDARPAADRLPLGDPAGWRPARRLCCMAAPRSPGWLIKHDWRPTRLRFGEVSLDVTDRAVEPPRWRRAAVGSSVSSPALHRHSVPPKRRRTRLFPDNQRELCLATAWRLVEDGQTVLIFCPERRSVEPFADVIVDLHERGALRSLLEADPTP